MPQMMPLKWLMYYFMFLIMMLMMMSMIHFIKSNKFSKNYNKIFKKNWNWK